MSDKKDLVVLTADKDAHLGISALLNRQADLGTRPIALECIAHPKHDSGVLMTAHHFLRPFLRYFEYALVVFDLEGCGQEKLGESAWSGESEATLRSMVGTADAKPSPWSLSWNLGYGMIHFG
jgi:hypothetical protein